MSLKPHSAPHACSKGGSALVITLSALVLISVILLVFFQLSSVHRQISFSSAGQFRADVTAHTALDTIIGDLRNEIVAGSTQKTEGTTVIYTPTSNQTAVPYRDPGNTQGFANLIATSTSGSKFWTGGNYSSQGPVRSASNNSTISPSLNGRYILANRWNKPGLLSDPGNGTAPNAPISTTGGAYVPPDWVLVTRQGPVTDAGSIGSAAGLSDSSSENTNYVIGRYAYTIYNEGGLLDVNVAGCPQSLVGNDLNTKRGVLPQVNLADLLSNPAIADSGATSHANALVQWRNQASAASTSAFKDYLDKSANGFATVMPGDQAFLSRQDLIDYVKNNGITTAALPYLGTFTRELNAPSYAPPKLRDRQDSPRRPTNQTEGYHLVASIPSGIDDDQFNPSLVDTRVTQVFTRYSDNTKTKVGEPLIKYRFPLSRLAWIGFDGHRATRADGSAITTADGSAVTDVDTQNAFGLSWNGSAWVYGHPGENNTGRILTLKEVANVSPPREPDFFELLQAGMFVGSLGKKSGSNFTDTTAGANALDSNPFYQVIQIGANLIDQADGDSYPTRIVFDSNASFRPYEFDGVESLPYISRVWETCYRHRDTGGNYGIWYVPEVWNPNISKVTSGVGPTSFKFTVNGGPDPKAEGKTWAHVRLTKADPPLVPPVSLTSDSPTSFPSATNISTGDGLTFGNLSIFETPRLITPDLLSSLPSNYNYIDETSKGGSKFCGIFAGELAVPNGRGDSVGPVVSTSNPLTFQISYQDSNGNWVPYSRVRYVIGGQGDSGSFGNGANASTWDRVRFSVLDIRSDPRTDRFSMEGTGGTGFGGSVFNVQTAPYPVPVRDPINAPTSPMRPTAAVGMNGKVNLPDPDHKLGWSSSTIYPYVLADNYGSSSDTSLYSGHNPSSTYYRDPDNIPRRADGAYNGGEGGSFNKGGYPLAYPPLMNNADSRPLILNRPFRSVGDMGYAFRDAPWKHIDFFTAESADSALLDLFCINESPKPIDPNADPAAVPIAGRVDLNTRQAPVLQAILTGAMQWDDGNQPLSANDAKDLAENLVNLTSDSTNDPKKGPLLNRSELATRWISSLPNLKQSPSTTVKRQIEAPVRALAEVGNTRTWNLLIDVIAQSGRYVPTGGTDLNKQFNVEGEKRYWLHVALDRYTGAIVAKSLESVYE